MKTVNEWLAGILDDPEAMRDWLSRQYRGEVRAVGKIGALIDGARSDLEAVVLRNISQDEARHARWIKELYYRLYGEYPDADQENASNRYWAAQEDQDFTQDELYALGAHAETMRLARIRAIVYSYRVNDEIREVFERILIDETFHASAFMCMASSDAMADMQDYHEKGLEALGLVL